MKHLLYLIQNFAHITDDDFDKAELSEVETDSVITQIVDAGYTIGKDADWRNEWWPPNEDS